MSVLQSTDSLRARFCSAMSEMYKREVPLYADLLSIVETVDKKQSQTVVPDRNRVERHGAIRLGTAEELQTAARLFALFSMHPVGYYDLSKVGLPLHATAFRPLTVAELNVNPFRVFTSLLRLDLLSEDVREMAEEMLSRRKVFSDRLIVLIRQAESEKRLTLEEEEELITEALKSFQWQSDTQIPHSQYQKMTEIHPIVADIVSFPSAHINHLTPRTIDIDLVQQAMGRQGMNPKERIEGPPKRKCAILLRQTSFKALEEKVRFIDNHGGSVNGQHTARFGEVEQRGAAVTPKGRELYDQLLRVTADVAASGIDDEKKSYSKALTDAFKAFPDDWTELQSQRLVYFRYTTTGKAVPQDRESLSCSLSELVHGGQIAYEPIVYEDFLPISAAGIFKSNLGRDSDKVNGTPPGGFDLMFDCLGRKPIDPNEIYKAIEDASIRQCCESLRLQITCF